MILGLDVGGTQADAVLLEGNRVLVETKTPTEDDLLETLRSSLDKTLSGVDPAQIERMAFSTTTAMNAIIQDRLEPTGMIVTAGPGMDPDWFAVGPSFHAVEGCLNHQGFEASPLNKESVLSAAAKIQRQGIKTLGVAGKFSVRNPAHEMQITQWTEGYFSHIALGHRIAGVLNFPRRISTTYLNAALHGLYARFLDALKQILNEKNLHAPGYLLKPDGGTVTLEKSLESPARTAQSGPAASVMGALALDGCEGTALVLDIGGTSTDMAVVLDGLPLLEKQGIRLGSFPTLIRSLLTHSVAVGGDSEIWIDEGGALRIGPLRKGRPLAFGGSILTPTDAMVTLGLLEAGNRVAAGEGVENLGRVLGRDLKTTAERVLEKTAEIIADSARAFLQEINSRPVYTVHEVLQEQRIEPTCLVLIGGPAPQIAPYVGKSLGLPYRVPVHFGVANAVGAAVARVTSEITLHADTERGVVIIPEADMQKPIDHRFKIDQAVQLAREVLKERALMEGADPDALHLSITEKQIFNMIRGYSRTGQNIRLKMCVTPGLIPRWERKR